MTDSPGILTPKMRAFLESADVYEDYNRQDRHRYRENIRKRVRNAMRDFHLLAHEFPDGQLEEVFELKVEERPGTEDEEIETWHRASDENVVGYIHLVFTFLARAGDLDDHPIIPEYDGPQPAFKDFTRHAETGIETFLATRKRMNADVSVAVEIESAEPVEELIEKAESGEGEFPPALDVFRLFPALDDEEREILQQRLERERDE